MSYSPPFISPTIAYVDPNDDNRGFQYNFLAIPTGTIISITLPATSFTPVGTTLTQTLTDKTITDNTNNVASKFVLTSTGTLVSTNTSIPTGPNQALMSTSDLTVATWQPIVGTVYINNLGILSTTTSANIVEFQGKAVTTTGVATFNVTTDGTATGPNIYSSLANADKQATAENNTATLINIPLASIKASTAKQVTVNAITGVSVLISILGFTLVTVAFAPNGTLINLNVRGIA